jgi:hypothetical protein
MPMTDATRSKKIRQVLAEHARLDVNLIADSADLFQAA